MNIAISTYCVQCFYSTAGRALGEQRMSLSLLLQRKAQTEAHADVSSERAQEDNGDGAEQADQLDEQEDCRQDPDYLYFKSLPDNGFMLLHILHQLADVPTTDIDLDTMVMEMPETKEDESLYTQTETDKMSVFITNIARTVNEAILRTELNAICPVQAIHFGRGPSHKLRTAVARFASAADVNEVISKKHGTLLHGERLTVIPKRTYAGPQSESTKSFGGGRSHRRRPRGRFTHGRFS